MEIFEASDHREIPTWVGTCETDVWNVPWLRHCVESISKSTWDFRIKNWGVFKGCCVRSVDSACSKRRNECTETSVFARHMHVCVDLVQRNLSTTRLFMILGHSETRDAGQYLVSPISGMQENCGPSDMVELNCKVAYKNWLYNVVMTSMMRVRVSWILLSSNFKSDFPVRKFEVSS
jgi:hypothetical protein